MSSLSALPTLNPPWWQFNGHMQTIIPALTRKVRPDLQARRERISTPDDDFLDLDWYQRGSKVLVIVSHGLEGDSQRAYVLGMVRALLHTGADCLAWNYRGCSGEMNRQARFYHSGATDDLHTVVQHASQQGYAAICLAGFSLGGNLTLKYLGEQGVAAQGIIAAAVTFSVPLNLDSSCTVISQPGNWMYSDRFLRSLRQKVNEKEAAMPGTFDLQLLQRIQRLREFDDHFTGPMHGFRDAVDYYTQCSSIRFLDQIKVPALVVNALNDPFLAPDCFPEQTYRGHAFVQVEVPRRGGHVGFRLQGRSDYYWSELRAQAFLKPYLTV